MERFLVDPPMPETHTPGPITPLFEIRPAIKVRAYLIIGFPYKVLLSPYFSGCFEGVDQPYGVIHHERWFRKMWILSIKLSRT